MAVTRWEIERVHIEIKHGDGGWKEAEKMASEGWELVGTVTYPDATMPGYILFFKRPLPSDSKSTMA